MKLRIDGIETDAEGTLLEACRSRGVEVPTACFDARTERGGHCRLCMVEVDGRLEPACTTPVRSGVDVATDSDRLRAYRRDLGELMVAESSPAGAVGRLLAAWGVDGSRYRRDADDAAPARKDGSHAFLRLDMDACIRCRLCVDVCAGVQGQFVYAPAGRGAGTRIDWGAADFAGTDCVSCGACAEACPTSAISDVDRERSGAGGERDRTRWRKVRTTCSYCGVGCRLDVYTDVDRIAFVDAAPSPAGRAHLCVKGRYAHSFVRHPERLTSPLLRRGDSFEPIGWDEAISLVAREFSRLRGRLGFLSSSRCTNEENYLVQKWARAGLGTNNVDCCARVCHAPSAVGMRRSFGTGAATNSFGDIERADLLLVVGSNTTESHPVVGARVRQAVLAGAKLIVIDPRRTELAAIADVHLAPRPGGNVALLNAMAATIVEEDLADRGFVASRADGFDELRRFFEDKTPERSEAASGVPAPLVREAARLYATARRSMQLHGLGVTEHYQGSEAVMLLCNLAVLCGAVGREGTGVNPLRGQNNVQGAADMGCQPDLLTGYAPVASPAVRERLGSMWQGAIPEQPGLTIPRMYDAIDDGTLAGLFILGEDVAATDPDSSRVRATLSRLEFLVVEEIFLSPTARLAHLVLPGASGFEKDGTFTNAERRVQRVREVLPPPAGARPDWRILADLMHATGMAARYAHPGEIFDEIAVAWPALAGVTYENLGDHGLQWPVATGDGGPQGTAILHRDGFAGGRMKLHCIEDEPSPAHAGDLRPLVLTTGRVLEHYNSGSMTRRSDAVHLVGRDHLEIHPADAGPRGIANGDRVEIESATGRCHATARVTDAVPRGCLFLSFHFPETATNEVTGDVLDRLADCPEYKMTLVDVTKG